MISFKLSQLNIKSLSSYLIYVAMTRVWGVRGDDLPKFLLPNWLREPSPLSEGKEMNWI